MSEEGKEEIRKRAREIRQKGYKKITVEGHTDATGAEEINARLSLKRAKAVYRELLLSGLSARKMSYMGFGSRMPIESNETKTGRAANRRTEIYVE